MIQAIVYDADGMVITPPSMFSEYFSQLQHLPSETVIPFFTHDFKQCLLGKLDLKQALCPYLDKWHWTRGVDALLELWFDYENCPNQPLLDSIQALRQKGILCVLATNQESYRSQFMTQTMHLDHYFDKLYVSHVIGALKPEPRFFDYLLKDLHLDKSAILFWDDRPGYVQSAQAYGFQAQVYQSLDQYLQTISRLL